MKTIIKIGTETRELGQIVWAVDEDFTELKEYGPVYLTKTKAVDIEAMSGLSLTSKILLSAVAGAAWQHIFDVMRRDRSLQLPAYTELFVMIEK